MFPVVFHILAPPPQKKPKIQYLFLLSCIVISWLVSLILFGFVAQKMLLRDKIFVLNYAVFISLILFPPPWAKETSSVLSSRNSSTSRPYINVADEISRSYTNQQEMYWNYRDEKERLVAVLNSEYNHSLIR